VHLIVDALGLPLTFETTEGQRNDIVLAKELVARGLSRCVLADEAYDARDFRISLDEQGCERRGRRDRMRHALAANLTPTLRRLAQAG